MDQGINENKIHTDNGEPIKSVIKLQNSKGKIKFCMSKLRH